MDKKEYIQEKQETEKQRAARYKGYQRYVNKKAKETFKRPAFAYTKLGGRK